jgi:hypothetical protein
VHAGRLFDELVDAARKVGIDVRVEAFGSSRARGGLCVLRGKRVILVDEAAPLPDRIGVLARALSKVDLEGIFLPPAVRAAIVAGGVHPPRPPRPLARTRGRGDDD